MQDEELEYGHATAVALPRARRERRGRVAGARTGRARFARLAGRGGFTASGGRWWQKPARRDRSRNCSVPGPVTVDESDLRGPAPPSKRRPPNASLRHHQEWAPGGAAVSSTFAIGCTSARPWHGPRSTRCCSAGSGGAALPEMGATHPGYQGTPHGGESESWPVCSGPALGRARPKQHAHERRRRAGLSEEGTRRGQGRGEPALPERLSGHPPLRVRAGDGPGPRRRRCWMTRRTPGRAGSWARRVFRAHHAGRILRHAGPLQHGWFRVAGRVVAPDPPWHEPPPARVSTRPSPAVRTAFTPQ